MDKKEEVLTDFLKGLRVALNNASVYFKEHPYYIKSVKEFKQKIDTSFTFLNPIKINVAPNSLFVDGKHWDKFAWYVELAQIFHLRKIKDIQINEGVTVEELIDFLSTASLPTKEVLRQGGIQKILNQYHHPHISINELDYSQLLGDEGEEVKDVWVYLFKEAVDNKDSGKIKEFTEHFEKIIGKFKAKDLLEDEELRKNLYNFLTYLKDHQREEFNKCMQGMFRSVMKYKDALQEDQVKKMEVLFKDLNEDEFANLLWSEILTNENFDVLSFKLFSRLTSEEKSKEIASTLAKKILKKEDPQDHYKAIKKIQDLLSAPGGHFISEVYRNTLSSIFGQISFEEEISFNRNLLHMNYRFVLLNLLDGEKDQERLNLILERFSGEWQVIAQEKDFAYLKSLWIILKKIKKEEPSPGHLFEGLDRQILEFIESIAWEERVHPELGYFIDSLQEPTFDADFYLNKIFLENNVNPYGLKLFLKFFPADLSRFYQNLEQKKSDIEFLGAIIESLKMLAFPLTAEILKYIYSFAGEFIKIEVLKAMHELPGMDAEFLLSILNKEDALLKKEALVVLAREEETKKEAIRIMFSISNPWGMKNKIILENLAIIDEVGLKEASSYLSSFSKNKFFWNRNIRKKAKNILEKWNV